MSTTLRQSPLHAQHVEAGARMVPFAGFEMPVLYTSILDEHRAVRERAGLFDVSHMGEIRVRGEEALPFAQAVFSNDLLESAAGRVRYGLLCLEDGGVVDDVTAYREEAREILFCVNASNIEADLAWLEEARAKLGLRCEIIDESAGTALLAIQGPRALAIVDALRDAGSDRPRRWHFADVQLAGTPVRLSRTGYTGEDGFEIYLPAEQAPELWGKLLEQGGANLQPAGLGARDTLRTEMGFPLYGHELDCDHNPLEAGLERFLAFGRGFSGEKALRELREAGPAQRLVGLILEGRQVARTGYPILGEDRIGTVTSGTYGPSVGRSIAIGYVPASFAAPGERLEIEVRGRRVPCEVVRIPFYERPK